MTTDVDVPEGFERALEVFRPHLGAPAFEHFQDLYPRRSQKRTIEEVCSSSRPKKRSFVFNCLNPASAESARKDESI